MGDEGKQSKRQAKQLWTDGRRLAALGDYAALTALDRQIVELGGDETTALARRELEQLGVDPVVVKVGLATLALYALAWLAAFV